MKMNKPCFDKDCSELLDYRKQAKLQRLQHPTEINWDNLQNIIRKGRRHFWNKKKENLKDKNNELATNGNNRTSETSMSYI
jgi:hypothetical protein